MNVLILKLLALTSMIIDHYGAIFQSNIDIYRIVGRIAFPLYCFLLVEGYFHTKDVKKYAKRLFIFAIISELPFDLAFYGKLGFTHQNIFFTLLIGLGAMYFLDNKEKYKLNEISILLISGFLAIILSVDYNFIGIIYILVFYYTKDYPKRKGLTVAAFIIFITNLVTLRVTQQFALLAIPILLLYNEELGPKNKALQILFYVAYPLHLALFYLVNVM